MDGRLVDRFARRSSLLLPAPLRGAARVAFAVRRGRTGDPRADLLLFAVAVAAVLVTHVRRRRDPSRA